MFVSQWGGAVPSIHGLGVNMMTHEDHIITQSFRGQFDVPVMEFAESEIRLQGVVCQGGR